MPGRGGESIWLWPHRIRRLFRAFNVLRRDGVYYPFAGRIAVRFPALADALSYTARWRPWCYLTQQIVLTVRARPSGSVLENDTGA